MRSAARASHATSPAHLEVGRTRVGASLLGWFRRLLASVDAEAVCPPTALAIADNNAPPSVYALAQARLDPMRRWLETEGAMLPGSEHLITGDSVLLVHVCGGGGGMRTRACAEQGVFEHTLHCRYMRTIRLTCRPATAPPPLARPPARPPARSHARMHPPNQVHRNTCPTHDTHTAPLAYALNHQAIQTTRAYATYTRASYQVLRIPLANTLAAATTSFPAFLPGIHCSIFAIV